MVITTIRNPILRTIAGLLTIVIVFFAVVGISYEAGRLVLPEGYDFITYFLMGVLTAVMVLGVIGVLSALSWFLGKGLVGCWILDALAGLGIFVGLYVAVTISLYLLGRLAVVIWRPVFYEGSAFMDYVGSGCRVVILAGLLGALIYAGSLVGNWLYNRTG